MFLYYFGCFRTDSAVVGLMLTKVMPGTQKTLGWHMKVGVEDLTAKEHLSGGLVAGTFSAVLTSPIDAVKTRMQVCIFTTRQKSLHAFPLLFLSHEGSRYFQHVGLFLQTRGNNVALLFLPH
jgi:hypothetical protein